MSLKAGDRVRVLKKNADYATVEVGDNGTVSNDPSDSRANVLVKMDNLRGGFDNSGSSYDWSINPRYLELVPPTTTSEEHDEAVRVLAKISKELGVMVTLTVYPNVDQEA